MYTKVVTFGEIMMRLSPPGSLRLVQARSFDVTYGGGEANVAVGLSSLGIPVEFVSLIPSNLIGDACLNYLRQYGVGVSHIVRKGDRLGIYFLEVGAAQRASEVIYDRANSSFSLITSGSIQWEKVFSQTSWFHWTGITPAISKNAAESCLEATKEAKRLGLIVSSDLNYRSKLWKWGKTAQEVMNELLKYVDVVICNEEDAAKVFGIQAPGVDVDSGKVVSENYRFVAEKIMERFPNVTKVAITLRTSLSASHNVWTAVLFDGHNFFTSTSYQITNIVDRVGAGDAFAAALIRGFLRPDVDLQRTLDFAVAASCLKHTIFGDSNIISEEEASKLAMGKASGRVSR